MHHQGFFRPTLTPDINMSMRQASRLDGVVGLHRNNLFSRTEISEEALSLRGGGGVDTHLITYSKRLDSGKSLNYAPRSYSSTRLPSNQVEGVLSIGHRHQRIVSATHLSHKTLSNSYTKRFQKEDSMTREASEHSTELDSVHATSSISRTRLQCFKTKMCHFYLQQKCSRGSNCVFAHSPDELRLTPDLSKTKMCVKWKKGLCFEDSSMCSYAHGVAELQPCSNTDDAEIENHPLENNILQATTLMMNDDSTMSPNETDESNSRNVFEHNPICSIHANQINPSVAYGFSHVDGHSASVMATSTHSIQTSSPVHPPCNNVQTITQPQSLTHVQCIKSMDQSQSSGFIHGDSNGSLSNDDDRLDSSHETIDNQSWQSFERLTDKSESYEVNQKNIQMTGEKILRESNAVKYSHGNHDDYVFKEGFPIEYSNTKLAGDDAEKLNPCEQSIYPILDLTNSYMNEYVYSSAFPYHTEVGFYLNSSYGQPLAKDNINYNQASDSLNSNESTTTILKYSPSSFRRFFPAHVLTDSLDGTIRTLAPTGSPLTESRRLVSGSPSLTPTLPGPVMVQIPQHPSNQTSSTPSHYILHNGYLMPLVLTTSQLHPSPHGNHQPTTVSNTFKSAQ